MQALRGLALGAGQIAVRYLNIQLHERLLMAGVVVLCSR